MSWCEFRTPAPLVQELLDFAATYDGYGYFAAEPEQLQRLVGGVYDEIVNSLAVPDWVRIDLARATLFYAYRADYFAGGVRPVRTHRRGGQAHPTSQRWVGHAPGSPRRRSDARATDGANFGHHRRVLRLRGVLRRSRVPLVVRASAGRPDRRLCFVGLNPATGDTDGKPRPTLNKVVGLGPTGRLRRRRRGEPLRLPLHRSSQLVLGTGRHRR